MSYHTQSIRKLLDMMKKQELLLPAFQRKYVWGPDRVESLMDSLMRGYPIGTFLFWEIEGEAFNKGEYTFYQFMNQINEYDRYRNPKAEPHTDSTVIWTALDGQQRLTSLYIAFRGSLGVHERNRPWKKKESYPDKILYVNLLHDFTLDKDETESTGFRFYADGHVPADSEGCFWFKVASISKYDSYEDMINFWRDNSTDTLFLANLQKLHIIETDPELLNYYLTSKNDIDDVLEIFVRVNSGAVTLSRSDLLFSTIIANWPSARDKFDEALEQLNATGNGFRFSIDFIVRCALACTGAPMQMKVKTFSRSNVASIMESWSAIEAAMKQAVALVDSYGFNSDNLVSPNAVIPIVLYHFLYDKPSESARVELKKYLIIAQLNQIYGASADSALSTVNKRIREAGKQISIKAFRDLDFSGRRSFRFDEDDIQNLLDFRKGSRYAFMVLSLLSPDTRTGLYSWHQDHLHPFSGFNDENFQKFGLTAEQIENWLDMRDTLPNLYLLDPTFNESKNAMPLVEWMQRNPSENERIRSSYCEDVTSFEFKDFEQFMAARRNSMANRLREILID